MKLGEGGEVSQEARDEISTPPDQLETSMASSPAEWQHLRCLGAPSSFVRKSAVISSVGQYTSDIFPSSRTSRM